MIYVRVELNQFVWEKKEKQTKKEHKSNTLEFGKKHFKCVNGIRSIFVGKKSNKEKEV
jgi:hypothetical protein